MNGTLQVALAFSLLSLSVANYLVGCYYHVVSQYRQSEAKFQVEDINFSLCTHVMYSFAGIENSVIAWTEPFNDDKRMELLQNRRNEYNSQNVTAVKFILGVQTVSSTFSSIAQQNSSRQLFASSAVQFLRRYNFDGLEFDPLFPAAEDKHSFTLVCQELLLAFSNESTSTGNQRLLLGTTVVPGTMAQVTQLYEVLLLTSILDWVSVKAYNMLPNLETPRDTRLHSALFSSSVDDVYSADRAVQAWLREGVNSSKIILGMPAFGRSFTLSSSSEHGLLAAASGNGPASRYTPQDRGTIPYYDICSNATFQRNKVRAVPGGQMYSWDNTFWISFDEEQQAWDKCSYVKSNKLGGIALWSIDRDDFHGVFCNRSTYPLLRNISSCLLTEDRATQKIVTVEQHATDYVSTSELSTTVIHTFETTSVVTESTTEPPHWTFEAIATLPPFVRSRLLAGEFSCDKTIAKASELTSDAPSAAYISGPLIVLGIVFFLIKVPY